MKDCIFCRIVRGEIPCAKVYEDEAALAFLDIAPISPGHTLVIPKEHYRTLAEMPGQAFANAVGSKLARIAAGVVRGVGAEGFNVFITNEACSGQVVFHVHVHIIPRRKGDGFRPNWKHGEYAEGEMTALAGKIATAIT